VGPLPSKPAVSTAIPRDIGEPSCDHPRLADAGIVRIYSPNPYDRVLIHVASSFYELRDVSVVAVHYLGNYSVSADLNRG